MSFEVEVLEVKTRLLPDWDDHFANTVQPGLTIEKIEREVSTCGVLCGVYKEDVVFDDGVMWCDSVLSGCGICTRG